MENKKFTEQEIETIKEVILSNCRELKPVDDVSKLLVWGEDTKKVCDSLLRGIDKAKINKFNGIENFRVINFNIKQRITREQKEVIEKYVVAGGVVRALTWRHQLDQLLYKAFDEIKKLDDPDFLKNNEEEIQMRKS